MLACAYVVGIIIFMTEMTEERKAREVVRQWLQGLNLEKFFKDDEERLRAVLGNMPVEFYSDGDGLYYTYMAHRRDYFFEKRLEALQKELNRDKKAVEKAMMEILFRYTQDTAEDSLEKLPRGVKPQVKLEQDGIVICFSKEDLLKGHSISKKDIEDMLIDYIKAEGEPLNEKVVKEYLQNEDLIDLIVYRSLKNKPLEKFIKGVKEAIHYILYEEDGITARDVGEFLKKEKGIRR